MNEAQMVMPEARLYEEGLRYWPYRESLELTLEKICELAPRHGTLLDIMCGTGYLLGEISKRRPDLTLTGVDSDAKYVVYGATNYRRVTFEHGDVRTWTGDAPFDIVTCTGALHHVPYSDQEAAIANLTKLVTQKGVVLISDSYVGEFENETERKLAAAELGYEYLVATVLNGAPDAVVKWTAEILMNDVAMLEYKVAFAARLELLENYFPYVENTGVWPKEPARYGDWIHVCHE